MQTSPSCVISSSHHLPPPLSHQWHYRSLPLHPLSLSKTPSLLTSSPVRPDRPLRRGPQTQPNVEITCSTQRSSHQMSFQKEPGAIWFSLRPAKSSNMFLFLLLLEYFWIKCSCVITVNTQLRLVQSVFTSPPCIATRSAVFVFTCFLRRDYLRKYVNMSVVIKTNRGRESNHRHLLLKPAEENIKLYQRSKNFNKAGLSHLQNHFGINSNQHHSLDYHARCSSHLLHVWHHRIINYELNGATPSFMTQTWIVFHTFATRIRRMGLVWSGLLLRLFLLLLRLLLLLQHLWTTTDCCIPQEYNTGPTGDRYSVRKHWRENVVKKIKNNYN